MQYDAVTSINPNWNTARWEAPGDSSNAPKERQGLLMNKVHTREAKFMTRTQRYKLRSYIPEGGLDPACMRHGVGAGIREVRSPDRETGRVAVHP